MKLLRSVRSSNRFKLLREEKSSGWAGKLFQQRTTRWQKKYLRTSKRDCGRNSLKLCPRVAVLAIRTLKKVDASISTIPKIILYTNIRSKRSRRTSSLSSPRVTRRSRYARLLQYIKRLVKRRCTDSIFFTRPTECGDHTHVAYSSRGLT